MRLIDADALIEKMPTVMDMQDVYLPIHFKEWLIDDASTIDIVRCKECKHWANTDPEKIPTASIICGHMHPDDFCSYGERKEGEE